MARSKGGSGSVRIRCGRMAVVDQTATRNSGRRQRKWSCASTSRGGGESKSVPTSFGWKQVVRRVFPRNIGPRLGRSRRRRKRRKRKESSHLLPNSLIQGGRSRARQLGAYSAQIDATFSPPGPIRRFAPTSPFSPFQGQGDRIDCLHSLSVLGPGPRA